MRATPQPLPPFLVLPAVDVLDGRCVRLAGGDPTQVIVKGGDPAEVKRRLSVYLPYAREAFTAAGGAAALDLGCGRGEWLELLHEEGIPALGVDASGAMVRACTARGLRAEQAEILSFLRQLPAASVSVLTAFHVVEHLTFADLMELLDQSVRVLRPGGVAVFETPNPQNISVGAHTFYLDPTHVRPIPSQLLSYLAERQGLRDIKTLFLNPYPESVHLPPETCEVARFINDVFYGPRDCAIIARRT